MLNRIYNNMLIDHFDESDKMAFLSGPRQVGKTTISNLITKNSYYLNWDNTEHRKIIIKGTDSVFNFIGGNTLNYLQKE